MIELLVVVTTISVLFGLLLSAVGGARDAMRKVQCQSNLKQMAMGLQGFHGSHSLFPAGNPDMKTLGHS